MARFKCVDKRPAKKSPVGKAAPGTREARFKRIKKFGKKAFLLPGGTPSAKGVPSYPVVNQRGCFHCGMGRAAYTRIGQALSRREPASYKRRLRAQRKELIRTALAYSDPRDASNACNWAIAASKRYLRAGR